MAKPGIGILIAGGMPSPDKLRAMHKKEGSSDGMDPDATPMPEMDGEEGEYGEAGGERLAFNQMVAAMDKGDNAGAYSAFREAVRICVANMKDEEKAAPGGEMAA